MAPLHGWLSIAAVLLLVVSARGELQSLAHGTYRIGPNDIIRVQAFGEDDLTVERKVGGDGKIDYPLLGTIPVEGRTIEELQKALTSQLASGYLRHPKVAVSIVRHRNFYVGGEVRTPGGFPYEEGLTVQKALAMAGGFTQKSDRTGIKITRQTNHGLESLLMEPDAVVLPDDLIVVPAVQKFYVNGEVRTPGDYSYERGLTIHKAITMAGGFTDKAAKRSTKVLRVINGKEQSLEVRDWE